MRVVQERRAVVPALSPAPRSPRPRTRLLSVAGVAAAVVAADQSSKTWALHHTVGGRHVLWTLWFDLTYNSGAAFGIGHGITPFVEAAVVVAVAAFLIFGRRAVQRASTPVMLAVGLVLGGAIGNLADRVFRHLPHNPGAVVDFIAAARVGQKDWWPVFNVADSCIVVGVILLALALRRRPYGGGEGADG